MKSYKIAILWRGDRAARAAATPHNNRYYRVFAGLGGFGFNARTRENPDALLRDVAATGPWVSARPDVILKMGVKEVLHRTKHMGWGTDTELYHTADELHDAFPARLRSQGPCVLKQNRGNAGQGVWRVELIEPCAGQNALVSVLEARRGSM